MPFDRFLKSTKRIIYPHGVESINKFFIVFSRFEYALKANGYFSPHAQPDWEKFISENSDRFNKEKNKTLAESVKYIIDKPPKQQKVHDGTIIWDDHSMDINTPDVLKLVRYIRDIRNNLFHGGKFYGDYQPDVCRNSILLKSALFILEDLLELNVMVKTSFYTVT